MAGMGVTEFKWLRKHFDECVEGRKILLINRSIYHLFNQVIACDKGREIGRAHV